MPNVENLVSSLNSEAMCALQAFDFSGSHMVWDNEVDQILSDIYASMVRRTKTDIRAAGGEFRDQHRAYRFLHHLEDLVKRSEFLRVMVSAVELLLANQSRMPRLEPDDRRRLREGMPNFHYAVRAVLGRISSWREDIGATLDAFCVLEEPEESLENLLASLPDIIPNVYVSQGRDLVRRLADLWAERRAITVVATGLAPESDVLQELVDRLNSQGEDQRSIIMSFKALITQVLDVPPLRFLDLEFTARQLSEASSLYMTLFVRRRNITEELAHLESILGNILDSVDACED